MHARASRFGLAATVFAALLMVSAGTVAAGTGGPSPAPGTTTQNGKSADVGTFDCGSNGDGTTTCTGFSLNVFAGKMTDNVTGVTHSNQVCLGLDTWTTSDETGEFVGTAVSERGCALDLPNGAIKFGTNLSSATLVGVHFSVQRFDCTDKSNCIPGEIRTVAVTGSWVGVGPITSTKYRLSFGDGVCTENDSGKGTARQATFSGTIDGIAAGSNGYATMNDGKFTYRTRCSGV